MVYGQLGRFAPREGGRVSCRHCEGSEAIHQAESKNGLLRRFAPRNDGIGCLLKLSASFRDAPSWRRPGIHTPCGDVLVLNETQGLWIPGSLASLAPRNDGLLFMTYFS